jgi:hypothetical protein
MATPAINARVQRCVGPNRTKDGLACIGMGRGSEVVKHSLAVARVSLGVPGKTQEADNRGAQRA